MKFISHTKIICVALVAVMLMLMLGVTASASMRQGRVGETAGEDGFIDDSSDSAPGTGEFADDTSSHGDTSSAMNGADDSSAMDSSSADNSNDGSSDGSPVESVIDGIVTDAEGAVEDAGDAMGGMSIWGIIIAIVIVASIVILLFAFFSKRK